MKRNHLQRLAAIISGAICILFFHNCSPVHVADISKDASAKVGDNQTDGSDPKSPTNPDTPLTPNPHPYIPRDDQGNQMSPPPQDSWVYPGDDVRTAAYYRGLCKNAQLLQAHNLSDGSSYRNSIGSAILSGSHLVNVYNQIGSTILAASEIDTLVNQIGSTVVLNNGPNSPGLIHHVRNSIGATILCGLSADTLTSQIGATVVVDGDVGDVINSIGSVVIVGGSILRTQQNSIGSIVVVP